MSYTEYMRRKQLAMPVVLNTQKPTDASLFTSKLRMKASSDFQYNGNSVGVVGTTQNLSRIDGIIGVTANVKALNRPKDASAFTSYRGSQAIGNDSAYNRGRIVQVCDSNCIPAAPVADKTASTFTREVKNCHVEAEGIPKFVDNTIRLIGANIANPNCCVVTANHQDKDVTPLNLHPTQGPFKGIPSYPVPIQSQVAGLRVLPAQRGFTYTPVKVGAPYTPKSGYVENHHGNDLGVNVRRVPNPFIPPTGIDHLKINNPAKSLSS